MSLTICDYENQAYAVSQSNQGFAGRKEGVDTQEPDGHNEKETPNDGKEGKVGGEIFIDGMEN